MKHPDGGKPPRWGEGKPFVPPVARAKQAPALSTLLAQHKVAHRKALKKASGTTMLDSLKEFAGTYYLRMPAVNSLSNSLLLIRKEFAEHAHAHGSEIDDEHEIEDALTLLQRYA